MMKLRFIAIASVLFLLCGSMASAQKGMKKADKLLSLKAFDLAIKNYESIVSLDPQNAKAFAQLGEAYRMSNQPLEALSAYEKAFALTDDLDAEYMLQYAHTLKRVGLYAQASSWYAAYSTTDAEQADYFITSTEFAKELLQEKQKYDIVLFEGNSSESDFGPAFYKDHIVYSSFRNDIKRTNAKLNESHINQPGNQLFSMEKGGAEKPAFLRPDNKEIHNIGPVSYSKDGRMVTFMKNSFTRTSNWVFADESDMSIYFAFTDETGDFGEAKPFSYNQVDYAYGFPNLGLGGKALYFASNQPGGFGGFDIYVSYLRDGEWSKPENLGANVNSVGNEISPYFDGEQLYFASDYLPGLGGYDVFSTSVVDGSWSAAKNVGKGANSPADDYYAVKDLETGALYITSNRLGGRGKSDIYIAYPIQETPVMEEEVALEVPKAVSLEELAQQNAPKEEVPDVEVINTEEVVPVSAAETVTLVAAEEEYLFDVSGATFLSAAEEDNAEVFFIQLASLSKSNGTTSKFNNAGQYGRLYRFFKSNAVKIRLGYYSSMAEAESVLPSVRSLGYRDAFVTADVLSMSQFELINSNSLPANSFIDDYNVTSNYKVKLASYQDPLQFNVESIKDAGRIEQWTKGKWTIFVLGGFSTLEDAQRARIKAINRGWTDAQLVIDEGGILRHVKSR